mmetsp:Transcript_35342/g.31801  ORF Transcript_35342/g.31801 Transcript_35342/m.31801 type:complete len:155 (-) Transcript_35342:457-921(-)
MIVELNDPKVIQIFLVKKINCTTCVSASLDVIKKCQQYPVKIYVEPVCLEEFKSIDYEGINKDELYPFQPEDEKKIDLIIVVGGDGSILWCLKFFQNRIAPPIVTFSKGTLGYLCNFSIKNYEKIIEGLINKIIKKKPLNFEKRARLQAKVTDL